MKIWEFLKRLRGLSLVNRWNFHYVIKHENVAEHSFWVAIYAMLISDLMELPVETKMLILRGALTHDWEESVTSDLPSLVKRDYKEQWRVVEERGWENLMENIGSDFLRYKSAWLLSREDTEVKKIIKAGDLLSRMFYAHDERMRGNRTFNLIELETVKQLRSLKINVLDDMLTNAGYGKGCDLPELMTHL